MAISCQVKQVGVVAISVLFSLSAKNLISNLADFEKELQTGDKDEPFSEITKGLAENSTELSEQIVVKTPVITLGKEISDTRVDKVYTIGCFDLSHHGHVVLFERMRQLGKTLIIGVHDSRR
jgi:hypothetical protein